MKIHLGSLALVATLLPFGGPAKAGEDAFRLKPGDGVEIVEQSCTACHSLDYIQMNAPFLDEKGWQSEVTKMVKAFGAAVAEEDQAKIVAYLVAQYGKE